jgi:hypothetical protein
MTSRLYSFFASEYKDNSDRDITIIKYADKVRSVMLPNQDYSEKKIVNILFRFVEDVLGSCIEPGKMSPVEEYIIGTVIALIEKYDPHVPNNDPPGVTQIGLYMPGSNITPIDMSHLDKDIALIALSSFVGFIRPSLPAPIPNGERYTKLNIYDIRLINGMNLNNINNDLPIFQQVFNAFKIAATPPLPPPQRIQVAVLPSSVRGSDNNNMDWLGYSHPAPHTVQAFPSPPPAKAFPSPPPAKAFLLPAPPAPPPVAVAAAAASQYNNNNTKMSDPHASSPAQTFPYTFTKQLTKEDKVPDLIPDYSTSDDFEIKRTMKRPMKRRMISFNNGLLPMEESGGMRNNNNTRKRKNKHTRKNRQKHRLNKTKTKTKTKSKTNRK